MNIRKFIKRNSDDLYHVTVPVVFVLLLAPETFAGSVLFLIGWTVFRSARRYLENGG